MSKPLAAWEIQQQSAFIRWLNNKLKKVPDAPKVNTVADLADGIALNMLLQAEFPTSQYPKYNRAPKIAAHRLDNLSVFFGFLDKAGIKTLSKPQNVHEGNITMILGLMWTLILELDINRAMKAASAQNALGQNKRAFEYKPGAARENLLNWTRAHTAPYGCEPRNFDADFTDGTALLALVHSLRPDLFKWNTMDKSNSRNNVVTAMNLADKHMGIPPLLDPDSLVSGAPDEKSVMAYVVNFANYETENKEKIQQVQQEVGEEARNLEKASVAKQRDQLQREAALLEAQRRDQEARFREEERKQQEELERQRADLEAQRRKIEEMGAQRTAEMAARQRELLEIEQRNLEEQRRMQEIKIKEEELRQQEELARQQQAIDDERRRMDEMRAETAARQAELMRQQQEELARQQREIEEQRRQMEESQRRTAEMEKSKLAQQKQELEAQRKKMEEEKAKLAEMERKKLLAEKKRIEEEKLAIQEQQRQLKQVEEQKRKLLELEKKKAELAQQQRDLQKAEEQRRAVLIKQQELLKQKAALDQERSNLTAAAAAPKNKNLVNLSMASEVKRMSFFQAVAERQVRDYVLFVDKSGSMAGQRWDEARKAVESLAPQVTRACPGGISLYFFNDECVRIDNITTAQQVAGFFAKEKPDRGTNLHLALKHAFGVHYKKPLQPETWLVITDGAPDKPTHVYELLKQESAKFRSPDEVTVSFIQIGNENAATEYLRKLRGHLTFVDTLTQDDLPKREQFSTLFTTEN